VSLSRALLVVKIMRKKYMKVFTVIVHTNAQRKLVDLLHTLDQVSDFTFIHIKSLVIEMEKGNSL
jgi:hypothetical protein